MMLVLEEYIWVKNFKYVINYKLGFIFCFMVISVCSFILNIYYGIDLKIGLFLLIFIFNLEMGMEWYYKICFDIDYMRIKKLKLLKFFSQEQINELLSNVYDVEFWMKYLFLENFEFQGFIIGMLIDIMEEEVLFWFKFFFLECNVVVQEEKVSWLEGFI